MPRHWRLTWLTLLCLSLVLAACGSEDGNGSGTDTGSPTAGSSPTSEPSATATPSAIDPALTGTTWHVVWPYTIPDTQISLVFDDMSASGTDGCNQYQAQIQRASDGQLQVGDISRTEMGCITPEGVMEQADQYVQSLSRSTAYRIIGDQLQLINHSQGAPTIFMREGAEALDPALAADRWGLVEVNGKPAAPGSLVTLELFEGYLIGSNGCNGITGAMPIAIHGALTIDFDGFARDTRGCSSADIQAQMETVDATLEGATAYTLDNVQLTITDSANNRLVYAPLADALLIGRTWNVPMLYTELPDGGIEGHPLVEGTEMTLTLEADGTIHGTAICNTYRGTYTLDGATIAITSPLITTRMACLDPAGIMEQEQTFLDTLAHITTWSIDPNGLTLTTDDGRALRELNLS